MSAEKTHFQAINCWLKNAPSIDAEALRQINLHPLTLLKDIPGIDSTIECANCPASVGGEPEPINLFMSGDIYNRLCLEKCPHIIPNDERFKGVGTFSEWPENSHFFGG
jgi:hypothetical protein